MNSLNNKTEHHNKTNRLLVLIFCGLIFAPLLLTPFTSSNAGSKLDVENRIAATWPKLGVIKQGFTQYTKQINAYLDDHLAFRKELLSFYAKLHLKLLRSGSGGQAIIGEDGWLYLAGGNSLSNARGVVPMSQEDAQEWAAIAKTIRDAVESLSLIHI